jgi:hypothetical protein
LTQCLPHRDGQNKSGDDTERSAMTARKTEIPPALCAPT